MPTSDIKQHVSIAERTKWDKNVVDFNNHLGSGGVNNHKLGDGSVPGFSTNDYTNTEKTKLAGIENGALNNPHPDTHPYTMITGLHQVAWTGNYASLINIPTSFYAEGGRADTVGANIRITISNTAPASPTNDKEIWINPSTRLINIYSGNTWVALRAVYGQ